MSDPTYDVRAPNTLHNIPSLCMNCHSEGITKLLAITIPMFKEVIISSFYCEDCHHTEKQVTSAAGLADHVITYELKVDVVECSEADVMKDLSRTFIRTDTCSIKLVEVDVEIAPNRSEIITIEGMLMNMRESLIPGQEKRKLEDEDAYNKVQSILETMEMMQEGRESFTFVVTDRAGNAFITNPYAPDVDPRCTITKRLRTVEETIEMGYFADDANEVQAEGVISDADKDALIALAMKKINKKPKKASKAATIAPGRGDGYKSGGSKAALKVMSDTVLDKKPLDRYEKFVSDKDLQSAVFKSMCHQCGHNTSETRMCIVDIPYFRETIIMCSDCTYCQFRDSEIKPGGGISAQGSKITLSVTSIEDLSRDVLKSDNAAVSIPEIGIAMEHGTLGGKFSTVEGLLLDIQAQLQSTRTFYDGDSSLAEQRLKYDEMLSKLEDVIAVKTPFTFVIDDLSAQSFIEGRVDGQPDTSPFDDTTLTIEYYTRTEEQNDILGITGMVTEDYYVGEEAEDEDEDEEEEESEEETA